LIAHPDKTRIDVVCDNARYDKNKAWRAWRADKPICQVLLPPYSPNLNRMERFWKYLRQKLTTPLFTAQKASFAPPCSTFSPDSLSLGQPSRFY
jgi:transposase